MPKNPTKSKLTNHPPLIECRNLSKIINQQIILNHINLTIPRGKIIGLLGKNGAGKSTLLKTINDLIVPTSGQVLDLLPTRTHLSRQNYACQRRLKIFHRILQQFRAQTSQSSYQRLWAQPRYAHLAYE